MKTELPLLCLILFLVPLSTFGQDFVEDIEDIGYLISEGGEQAKILVDQIQSSLTEKNEVISQVFQGEWHAYQNNATSVPMVSNTFRQNTGDALVQISSFANLSSLDMTLLEGRYIDERIQVSIQGVDSVSRLFQVSDTETDQVILIDSAPGIYIVFSDLRIVQTLCKNISQSKLIECYFSVLIKVTKNDSSGITQLSLNEVFSNFTGKGCLPSDTMQIRISGSTQTAELVAKYDKKTWHLTFSITVLCLIATYFTFGELRAISQSLEDRELNGQTENHAKRMSLLSNAFICIWNMCYSITFFVTALYFKVTILLM